MYFGPPPAIVATEQFAVLPDELRKKVTGAKLGWASANFLEGPSFDRAGNLYCVDIFCGRIYRISPRAAWEVVVEYDGQPNGLKIHSDGRLFVADRKRGIVVVDPCTGSLEFPLPGPRRGTSFRGPNDLIFSKTGNLYFTDQGNTGLHDPTGCVYRWDPQDSLSCIIGNVPSPNGLVFNVRETILFLAVTRANAVWRIELGDATGHRAGLFTQLYSTGPDGLALDREGTVFIAHPGSGIVWGISKTGIPLYQMQSCSGPMPTNLAFGVSDPSILYIVESSSSSILKASLPYPGKEMFSHA